MLFFCLYVLECSLCVWSEICSGEELMFGVDLHFSSEVNTTAAFESIFAFMRESIFLVCMWCPSSLSGAQVITSRCRGTLSLQLSLWTSRAAGQAYEGRVLSDRIWPASGQHTLTVSDSSGDSTDPCVVSSVICPSAALGGCSPAFLRNLTCGLQMWSRGDRSQASGRGL